MAHNDDDLRFFLENNLYPDQLDAQPDSASRDLGYDKTTNLRDIFGLPGDEVGDLKWQVERHRQFGRDITDSIKGMMERGSNFQESVQELQRQGYSQREIGYGLYMGEHGDRIKEVTKEQITSDTPGWGQRGWGRRI
jgi:hypothetical protein